MRVTRLEKYRKQRRKGIKKLFFFLFVVPTFMLAAGYMISSLIIIPAMAK